ncbi:MAG: hypothetical protein OXE41_10790 [Gammaproteobacteria bacterium]|nr:hypothetical protein [Gammaproteobacteria bacterium]MCY4219717.1 hypothetical protein [Gammaproteobacteria bacterium]MCY4275861.1 hypothetical protein [Gammaproteobacteria bacterium]
MQTKIEWPQKGTQRQARERICGSFCHISFEVRNILAQRGFAGLSFEWVANLENFHKDII